MVHAAVENKCRHDEKRRISQNTITQYLATSTTTHTTIKSTRAAQYIPCKYAQKNLTHFYKQQPRIRESGRNLQTEGVLCNTRSHRNPQVEKITHRKF